MLKRQQFVDNRSEKTELIGSNCQRLYIYGNEEWESLNKFEGESKRRDIRYVSFHFVALS